MGDSLVGECISQDRGVRWSNVFLLPVWLAAGAVPFLPFAFDTSPWDAVLLRVPGNQGDWWHLFAAAPFFLAYPMLWLRLRALFTKEPLTTMGLRILWSVVVFSMAATTAVETPFLLHLAGTSEWQRLAVLCLGLGIMLGSASVLLLRRRNVSPARACIAGLEAAYLGNVALCLMVYSDATGSVWSRVGWFVSMVLVWPIGIELAGILAEARLTNS